MMLRPHDLLRLAEPARISVDVPGWVRTAVSTTPWVVVRRGDAPAGWVAVGVRGHDRAHRHALTISATQIADVATPEHLGACDLRAARDLPALRALAAARAHLEESGLPWGPTGSVGFELATGTPTVTPVSDLDLTVRAAAVTPAVLQRLTALEARLRSIPTRVDCQIETSIGAVALAELVSARSEVLVRSARGAALVPIAELPS